MSQSSSLNDRLPVHDNHPVQPVNSLVFEVCMVPVRAARACFEAIGECLSGRNGTLGDVPHPVHPRRALLVHSMEVYSGAL